MKKINFVLLLISIHLAEMTFAQYELRNLEINNEQTGPVENQIQMLGEIDNIIYYASTVDKDYVVTGISGSTNKEVFRNSIFTYETKKSGFSPYVRTQGIFKNQLAFIITDADQDGNIVYKLKTLDKNLEKKVDLKTLYTFEKDSKVSVTVNIFPDKIVLELIGKYDENLSATITYIEFDVNLNRKKDIKFDFSFNKKKYAFSNFYFDNQDNMFASIYWNELEDLKNKPGIHFNLGNLESSQSWDNETTIVKIDYRDNKVIPLHTHTFKGIEKGYVKSAPFIDHKGRFCLAHNYFDELTKDSNSGIAIYIFNAQSNAFEKTEIPFSKEFRTKYFNTRFPRQAENKIRNNPAINDLDLMNVLVAEDGSMQLIFEFQENKYFDKYDKAHKYLGKTHRKTAEDIIVFQLSESLENVWFSWIEKSQTGEDQSQYLSYFYFQSEGNLFIIFNDASANYENEDSSKKKKLKTFEPTYSKCVWVCCIIGANGVLEKGIYTPPENCYPSLCIGNNSNSARSYYSEKQKRFFAHTFIHAKKINIVSFKYQK